MPLFPPFGATLYVKDTILRNNSNDGLYVQGPGTANLDRVRLEGNPTGLLAQDGAQVSMQDSAVSGNNTGVVSFVAGGSAVTGISITRSLTSFNGNQGAFTLSGTPAPPIDI